MKSVLAAALIGISALPAEAEVKEEHFVVGDQQIWIEPIDPLEFLFFGRNEYERDQFLSGGDLEIVGFVSDTDDVALLGAPAIVVETLGTQTCGDLDEVARDYYVISLGEVPTLSEPAMTCKNLTMSITNGMLVLEENPSGDGEFWAWTPEGGLTLR
ncbi:hypothetical protein OU426_12865 [Frigidibacter sp. RF13]|uniref:hypothetical protein n=1 Tax=Frigidibacter sp. RF13 TaxID=2997340 RepID=UPI0022707C00|nr:hypothetical protein [Frigidibacter sp. RF13]MCY1127748.1 hypothetical protein [Frigidibacter sp. RF13]